MSVGTALGTAGVVLAIHSTMTPNNGTILATAPMDPNVESSRKQAAWTSVFVVSAISLLTRDVNVFVVGGAMTVALDWWTRYCIARHPATGQIVTNSPAAKPLSVVAG
jgi:hypothetical protein